MLEPIGSMSPIRPTQLSGVHTTSARTARTQPDRTVDAAAKLLSQLFFAPLLAEMRKDPFGAKFAKGGRTEEIFGEQLDTRIADAVAQSGAGGVTRQIAEQLTGRASEGVLA
jgi:Rod binding domain-containing protein